nr:MAG TPA: Protein of unknown function (DUF3847) [Caudoviricetes sp.]
MDHGSAHFYTGVPPVSSRALRESLSDRIRMRQTGRRGRCFRCGHRHLPLPPRAAALAPLCGYPKLMVTVLPYGGRRHGQLPFGPVASSTLRRRRNATMKKTKDELQNELTDAQRQQAQEQHRLQRAENRKEYFEATSRRQRNHRLITRGAALESIFPAIKPLTEREFYEMAEQLSELPGVFPILEEAISRHNAQEKLEAG